MPFPTGPRHLFNFLAVSSARPSPSDARPPHHLDPQVAGAAACRPGAGPSDATSCADLKIHVTKPRDWSSPWPKRWVGGLEFLRKILT